MKITSLSITPLIAAALLPCCLNAATFTVGGGSFVAINDSNGVTLETSSIVQVGYFNTPLSSTDPSSYSLDDWASFVAISGIDSLNSDKVTNVDNSLGPGTFSIGLSYDDSSDIVPESYPKRLGIRIYDSTSTTGPGIEYNTVSSNANNWVVSDPSSTNPPPTDPDVTIFGSETNITWEDNANPFKTTIVVVPEPSSFALLGLGVVALTFRRKK